MDSRSSNVFRSISSGSVDVLGGVGGCIGCCIGGCSERRNCLINRGRSDNLEGSLFSLVSDSFIDCSFKLVSLFHNTVNISTRESSNYDLSIQILALLSLILVHVIPLRNISRVEFGHLI